MSAPDFWTQVLSWASALDRLSYYQLLQVTPASSPEDIRKSFYGMAARLHPDRFAMERDGRKKQALSRLYARLREAYEVLIDPALKQEYDAAVARGDVRLDRSPGQTRKPATDPRDNKAQKFFQMAQDCLRRNDTQGARMNLKMAAQIEPESPAIRKALDALPAEKRGRK